jgi:hypothetical protein
VSIFNRYYIDDPIEEEEDLEFFLFSLLSPGGVLTEQVGDSLPVNNVHSLRENGFQRVVNYEEVSMMHFNGIRWNGRKMKSFQIQISLTFVTASVRIFGR